MMRTVARYICIKEYRHYKVGEVYAWDMLANKKYDLPWDFDFYKYFIGVGYHQEWVEERK